MRRSLLLLGLPAGHSGVCPEMRRIPSMNLRNVLKPLAAAILALGLTTAVVSPADAAPVHRTSNVRPLDTGWGFK